MIPCYQAIMFFNRRKKTLRVDPKKRRCQHVAISRDNQILFLMPRAEARGVAENVNCVNCQFSTTWVAWTIVFNLSIKVNINKINM